MDESDLQSIALFEPLSRVVAQHADRIKVPEGTELVRQGEFAYEFFVIVDGAAEVVRNGERIAELGPGDFLGEAAALDRGQRNATVVARSPMRLAVMTDRDLRAIARDMPDVDAQLRDAARAHCPLT